MLSHSSLLITGGTGSFGHTFVPMTLAKFNPRRLVIYSRDEMKQWEMAKLYGNDDRVFILTGARLIILINYPSVLRRKLSPLALATQTTMVYSALP